MYADSTINDDDDDDDDDLMHGEISPNRPLLNYSTDYDINYSNPVLIRSTET